MLKLIILKGTMDLGKKAVNTEIGKKALESFGKFSISKLAKNEAALSVCAKVMSYARWNK